jgi:outer membrane cobalamin receptor
MHSSRVIPWITFTFVVGGLARTASAQQPSPTPTPPVFYETATVTARPVSSATGAVTVLDASEIEASAARSATEALAMVPGLNALASGGRAGVTNAFLRGSDPNYTLVLLDGIPLNDSTELQGGAVNLEELALVSVDRIEVVRGPLTSFYGTSALAGVIQLFSPRGGPGPLRASAGLEAGNADLRHAFARLSGPLADGGFAAGASWDEERHRVAEDRFRQLDIWGTADLAFGRRALVALTGRFADGHADDYPDASGGPVYGDGLLRRRDHQDLALGARLDLGERTGARHRLFLGFARRVLDRTSPAVAPVVPESEEQTTYRRLRLGWQLPLVRRAGTTLEAGLSGEGEWGENTSALRLPAEAGGDVPGDYERDRLSAGAFAGLRHERGSFLYEAALRLDLPDGDSLQANPHLGLVWRPGQGQTRLRASLGRASKLPSFFALASPPALGGNPSLEPERVWGGEAGVEHAFHGPGIELGAAWFRQDYDNLVDFDFERFLHVNRARVRTQGVELSGRWQPRATLWLTVEATYLSVRDLAGGGLLHTPRWVSAGRLTWQPTPRLSLRLQTRSSSGYLDRQYPVPDRDSVSGYGLLGFAGSWRLRQGLSLRVRADNLTDSGYETLIGFPGPGRSFWAGIGWDRR